jgi:uncharacterized protein (DUF433 family)
MKDRSPRRSFIVWSEPGVHGGVPMVWGTGARVIDLLDRIDAGDSIEDVAKDFTFDEANLELLVALRDAIAPTQPTVTEAP